jgi:hypothetical protein
MSDVLIRLGASDEFEAIGELREAAYRPGGHLAFGYEVGHGTGL